MSKKQFVSTAGVTPAKLVLIGILAIVLITVVVLQIPGESPSPRSAKSTNQAESNRRVENKTDNAPKTRPNPTETMPEPSQHKWPERPLDAVLAYDPFAPPAWSGLQGDLDGGVATPSADGEEVDFHADRQALTELQDRGVSFVMISGADRMAKIGEDQVRVGDSIGGFVVQEINANGVVIVEGPSP